MKPLLLSFALVAMTSALPCTAQTGQAPVRSSAGHISPQDSQAYINELFKHRISGHATYTPQEIAKMAAIGTRLNDMERTAADALHAGDFGAAEAAYRSLIEADSLSPYVHYGLGDALAGQGKVADAIKEYRVGIYWPLNAGKALSDIPLSEPSRGKLTGCQNETAAASWMRCVLLLSQTGQGAEALALYKQALPRVPDANVPGMSLSLDSDTPAPETVQAAAHLALGLCATFSGGDSEKAMREFDAARRLRPEAALTNYYYGDGWSRLDPRSPLKKANTAQAKAAFQQAAALGDGEVKKAAAEALTGFK